ncbi:MAG: PotD/PotF family extracellular solute-binding protein [Candidatus Methylumidiphilus sp.]
MKYLALLLCLLPLGAAGETPEILLFNWSDYMPREVLQQFMQETGIAVRETTYDSNEALYAKLKLLGNGGYDVVVPSTYFVDKMRKDGMLLALDKTKLPNIQHLDAHHLDKPFDPGNRYSLPYLWGTTGIAVNTAKFPVESVKSWADLWKPIFRQRLLLPNDMREAFHIGLRVLGYSGNSIDPAQIRQAYELLRTLLPNVRIFTSDAIDVQLVTGEVDVGVAWSGVAGKAHAEDPAIQYVHPQEGVIIWMDNLAIPKNAPHPELAHRLLDFLLRPDIAQTITESVGYASPNRTAVQRLKPALRDDATAYPRDDILSKGEYQTDIGAAITLYTEYWERLKAE